MCQIFCIFNLVVMELNFKELLAYLKNRLLLMYFIQEILQIPLSTANKFLQLFTRLSLEMIPEPEP